MIHIKYLLSPNQPFLILAKMLLRPAWKIKLLLQLTVLGSPTSQLQMLFKKALGKTANPSAADDSLFWDTGVSPVQMQSARILVTFLSFLW